MNSNRDNSDVKGSNGFTLNLNCDDLEVKYGDGFTMSNLWLDIENTEDYIDSGDIDRHNQESTISVKSLTNEDWRKYTILSKSEGELV